VRLRLANQVRTLVGLTSQLVHDVDQEVTHERTQALASTERARDQLALVLSVTAAFTLLMAHRVWLVRNPQYHRATWQPWTRAQKL